MDGFSTTACSATEERTAAPRVFDILPIRWVSGLHSAESFSEGNEDGFSRITPFT
jgi:hypothetical protein